MLRLLLSAVLLLSTSLASTTTTPLSVISWNTHWQCGSDHIPGCRASATNVLVELAANFSADVVVSVEMETSATAPLDFATSARLGTAWTQVNGSCAGGEVGSGDAMALLLRSASFGRVKASGGGCLGGDAGGVYKASARAFAVALVEPASPQRGVAGCPDGLCIIGLHAPHIDITKGADVVASVCGEARHACTIAAGDWNAPVTRQSFCNYTLADRWSQLVGTVSPITAAGPDALSCCYPQLKYFGWDDHLATSIAGATVDKAEVLGYQMKQGDTEEHMPIHVSVTLPGPARATFSRMAGVTPSLHTARTAFAPLVRQVSPSSSSSSSSSSPSSI